MTVFDFRENAIHRAGGPQTRPIVEAVARFLHTHDVHPGVDWDHCDECWRRSGDALQAVKEIGVELVQPIGRAS